MKVITAIKGQTVADIAIKYYGSIDGLQMLLEDNPKIGGSNILEVDDLDGLPINIRDEIKLNSIIAGQFENKQIITN